MPSVTFRFHGVLSRFLQVEHHRQVVLHRFPGIATVKDRIEALGVPHTEVEAIRVNGIPVDFQWRLRDDDEVGVYPIVPSDGYSLPLRPARPRGRFVLDQHLARLAAYLRLMGQDVLHRAQWSDEALARVSVAEDRILLSRDTGLLMRKIVVHGGFVHAIDPMAQVPEVLRRFGAPETFSPFSRCMACNEPLAETTRDQVEDRLPPDTRRFYDRFWHCPGCGRVYWEGSHVRRMRGWIDRWLRELNEPAGPGSTSGAPGCP